MIICLISARSFFSYIPPGSIISPALVFGGGVRLGEWYKMETSNNTATLIEIFSSFQGEGPHVGEPMTFVRFEGCDLKCRWCDTPESFSIHSTYRVEEIPFSGEWVKYPNPVAPDELTKRIKCFSGRGESLNWVSLTGGEPLQQVDFLETWLPKVCQDYFFLLETNGVLPAALERLLPFVHTVSMDIKLPSSAKTGIFWKEHETFLNLAVQAKECYVKIVVTDQTEESEWVRAVEMIRHVNENIPVILQPVSGTRSFKNVASVKKLANFAEQAKKILPCVRVIPQTHKLLGIL